MIPRLTNVFTRRSCFRMIVLAALFGGVKGQGATTVSYRFDHLAGATGGAGDQDGAVASARFTSPSGVAFDAAGNLYVADSGNRIVRRITPQGVVSTLAGRAGVAGSTDGVGDAARFSEPYMLAVAPTGDVYVTDRAAHTLRRISAAGVVTTVAGSPGLWGRQDGRGANAYFNNPAGVTVTADGIVYVADSGNHAIRRVDPDGTVTTYAGSPGQSGSVNGTGGAARFSIPSGLALGPDGSLYVAEAGGGLIRKVAAGGVVTTVAGTPGAVGRQDGAANAATFYGPAGLVVTKTGTIYVTETANNDIRAISSAGVVSTLAGNGQSGSVDGAGAAARFSLPLGIAVDGDGVLYTADSSNHVIRRVTTAGEVTTYAGAAAASGAADGAGAAARFKTPWGVAVDEFGTVYVADEGNYTIRKITTDGTVSTLAGTAGSFGTQDGLRPAARFQYPHALAADGAGGLYVADTYVHTIRRVNFVGDVRTVAGLAGQSGSNDGAGTAARFYNPSGVAVDAAGNVFIADSLNNVIRKITPTGVVSTLAGLAGRAYMFDGTGSNAGFMDLESLALLPSGGLVVGDAYGALRQVTPEGVVTTLHVDRTGIWDVSGVATDGAGNIFVTDAEAHVIRRVAPDGTVMTIGGSAGQSGSNDGVGPDARFVRPRGIAVDAFGVVYVADSDANSIRRGVPIRSNPTPQVMNISTRAYCGGGDGVMIGGFVVSGDVPKRVLVRAVGASLTARGLARSEVLLDPIVEVHDAGHDNAVIASNDNWTEHAGAVAAIGSRIGASALQADDETSAALVLTLNAGVYTFVVKGHGEATGIALLEVYDADAFTTTASFTNISSRAYATTGDGVTIGGFVVAGSQPKRVLMRAVGPTLATKGLDAAAVLADPTIELHRGDTTVATNDNWGDNANAADIRTVAARIGATPLADSDTKSSALLLSLQPGVYSFIAQGKGGTSGIVLVEVYDAD